MSLTNQKIRIATPAISTAIQEDLFKQGYRWHSSKDTVKHTDAPYLYASEHGTLTYGYDDDNFDSKRYQEVLYTTQTKLTVVEKKPVRDKVALFGKIYFKDELDAAQENLRTAI